MVTSGRAPATENRHPTAVERPAFSTSRENLGAPGLDSETWDPVTAQPST